MHDVLYYIILCTVLRVLQTKKNKDHEKLFEAALWKPNFDWIIELSELSVNYYIIL